MFIFSVAVYQGFGGSLKFLSEGRLGIQLGSEKIAALACAARVKDRDPSQHLQVSSFARNCYEELLLGIPIAWYKARIPVFPRKSIREGASSLSGRGRRVPNLSLALEQPQGCTGASLGCSRARDILGSLRPRPEKTTCSFPYRFSGKNRNSGLVPGNRDPKLLLTIGSFFLVAGDFLLIIETFLLTEGICVCVS